MRIAKLRAQTEVALEAAGFSRHSFVWVDNPNRLIVSVAGRVRVVELGYGAAKMQRALGRIEGWKDAVA